ncbi:hypothetical protein ACFL35_09550 [Candidatus Riflebacteria bacterium]
MMAIGRKCRSFSIFSKSFTLVEAMIAVGIMSLLIFILLKLFVQKSMVFRELEQRLAEQGDTRITLELMYRDVSSSYRFTRLDPVQGVIEMICAQKDPTELSESFRGPNPKIGKKPDPTSLFLRVNKIRYYFKGGKSKDKRLGRTIYRKSTPGKFFLLTETFVPGGVKGKPRDLLALRHIEKFDFEAFSVDQKGIHTRVNPANKAMLARTSLLVLHIIMTKYEQEAGALKMSLNLYSRARISESLFPGYFNTIDRYVEF